MVQVEVLDVLRAVGLNKNLLAVNQALLPVIAVKLTCEHEALEQNRPFTRLAPEWWFCVSSKWG